MRRHVSQLDSVEPGADVVQERGWVFDERAAWDVLAEILEDAQAQVLAAAYGDAL